MEFRNIFVIISLTMILLLSACSQGVNKNSQDDDIRQHIDVNKNIDIDENNVDENNVDENNVDENEINNSEKNNISGSCTKNGGNWIENFEECEYINQNWCDNNGGIFNECESACRNNSEAEICTMQCVPVCSFLVEDESVTGPRNTSYIIDGEKVTLINGKAEKIIVPDSASKEIIGVFESNTKADLNNDGLEDNIVILTKDSGGSGTFYYVAVATKSEDGFIGSNAIFVGDRIAPQNNNYKDGKIIVNYAKRKPWESFSERPSIGTSKYLTLENGILKELELEKLSKEEAKKLVIENIGDCNKNECDNLKVNVLDGKDGIWYIETIFDGLKDDSIRASKKIHTVNFVNSKWEFGTELLNEFKCQKGRGHEDFGTEFCK